MFLWIVPVAFAINTTLETAQHRDQPALPGPVEGPNQQCAPDEPRKVHFIEEVSIKGLKYLLQATVSSVKESIKCCLNLISEKTKKAKQKGIWGNDWFVPGFFL